MSNARALQNIEAAKVPSAHALQIIGAARSAPAAPFPTPMPTTICMLEHGRPHFDRGHYSL